MARLMDTIRNRVREIATQVNTREIRLNAWERRGARHQGPGDYEWTDLGWSSIDVGDIWARQGQTVFLRRSVEIPSDWAGLKVGLELRTGGEGLLTIDGEPRHGIDDRRGYVLLADPAVGGERLACEIEMKTGGYLEYVSKDLHQPYLLSEARLIAIDPAVEAAYYDFLVTHEAACAISDPVQREAVLLAMRDALHVVDFRDKTSTAFRDGLARARKVLRTRLDAIRFGRSPGTIFFAGHSHIDVAWLWPLRETMRKVGRTYATVTALMDEFPDYHFVCSQVPLFLYLKEHFPTVYERVKQRVREGRFEPIGGTWVENDTNVVSGESLVRQCLYGKRFFREEFGVDVRVGWLPDVFGYSWALPQVYKKAGIDYFMTAKVAWNETNRIPHNTFWWEGIDGSRVFAHLVHNLGPMYNAHVKPAEIVKQWDDYASKLDCPEMLCPFGYGDGGGGPTREMLQYIPRLADIPGLPAARMGRVHDFFDRIHAHATGKSSVPPVRDGIRPPAVWNGEMYFERHRGTYTTQAANKRDNRRCELLYRDAEMFAVVASLLGGRYPTQELRAGWERILLNQFHDILPGSSIHEVYLDSARDYAAILDAGRTLRSEAMDYVARFIDTQGAGDPVIVYNTLSWPRTGIVTIDAPLDAGPCVVTNPDGDRMPAVVADGRLHFRAEDVPACGYMVFHIEPAKAVADKTPFRVSGRKVTGPRYEMQFDDGGAIVRLYDIARRRELLPPGARANVLQVFEDKPVSDDAWDIDLSYQDRAWEFTADGPPRVVERNALRLVLAQTLRYGRSEVNQKIVLYAHDDRIDFITSVNWQERMTLVKVAFPVDVHAPRATYEIAFGAIERPTHRNTSWDAAQYEVSGHRWADLSEGDYGVALLNDCKYGWDVEGNVLRLTLLRSPESPDPEADRGAHEFTYALLPHTGDWRSRVVFAGQELNVPLTAQTTDRHEGRLPRKRSTITADRPNVVIDTVKMAEDGDGLIVRVYEAHGSRGPVRLTLTRPVAFAEECNLLEEAVAPVGIDGFSVTFQIRPWEIRTFRIRTGESVTASAGLQAR